ncbi:hypothetical protein ACQJBY_044337 [Aegilops geniculata]
MQVSDAVNTGRWRHLEGTVMAKLWAPAGLLWIWRMAAGSGQRRTAPVRVGGTTAAAELLHGLLRFQGEHKEGRGGRARPAGSHLSYLHAAIDTTPEPRLRPMRLMPPAVPGSTIYLTSCVDSSSPHRHSAGPLSEIGVRISSCLCKSRGRLLDRISKSRSLPQRLQSRTTVPVDGSG